MSTTTLSLPIDAVTSIVAGSFVVGGDAGRGESKTVAETKTILGFDVFTASIAANVTAIGINTTDIATNAAGVAANLAALADKADLVGGVIPTSQLPSLAVAEFLGEVASELAMLALNGQRGDWCNRTDLSVDYRLVADDATLLASWRPIDGPASDVTTVNGQTGTVVLAAADIGAATAAQGGLADSALQPANITSGVITPGTADIDFDNLGGGLSAADIASGTIIPAIGNLDIDGLIGVNMEGGLSVGGGSFYTAMYQPRSTDYHSFVADLSTQPTSLRIFNTTGNNSSFAEIGWKNQSNTFRIEATKAGGGTFHPMRIMANSVTIEDRQTSSPHAEFDTDQITLTRPVVAAQPLRCGLYTFATVPTASSYAGSRITISDRSYRAAYSDGTVWRFESDDAVIS